MILALLKKIFGTQNERTLKSIQPIIAQINALEEGFKKLSDSELKLKTEEFKKRFAAGESLDALLPEAFATIREASWRVLRMRHYDVQLIGGIVLHRGNIAEMKTGEGKTLVATLPIYLNALSGQGAHVVTVNDYLARRDAEWMGQVYRFLGLSVGVIVHGLTDAERQLAYGSDITYGTNNEFGFDYLRDNMKYRIENYVQRPLNFAIVDEVDSILVDEARTPLIISGPSEDSTDKYYDLNRVPPLLTRGEPADPKTDTKTTGDYTVDEKSRSAVLTEQGVSKVEKILNIKNLYDPDNIEILHHVNQALKAHSLYKRDVDYVVKDGEVMIVDEFTGRLMPGRRWSDGLHQAVEAKEKVKIESENQTLATVTFQNFFRMYKKLSGMTGTAETEAAEFASIYKLNVVVIPTDRPMVRKDHADVIYKTETEKFNMLVEEIKELHEKGQPILVGTVSIEKSERVSELLKRRGITHHVLNAKQHEREAEIVAQAGRFGSVTIATNMAGRGTDIILGGNPEFMARSKLGVGGMGSVEEAGVDLAEYQKLLTQYRTQCEAEKKKVLAAGGLHIIGTERHESRRIDNQLRGRSGRQGDPGSSRFYLSLEDDLMRIFGSDRIKGMMTRLGMEENEPITHPWISKAIANAQKRVEGHNYEIRKNLLEYDDVMNKQRQTVYGLRRQVLEGKGIRDKILDYIDELAVVISAETVPEKVSKSELDFSSVDERVFKQFGRHLDFSSLGDHEVSQDALGEKIYKESVAHFESREEEYGAPVIEEISRMILLSTLDNLWKDHLLCMDHLREGIGLRGYGQKDPLMEYKREGFALFQGMLLRLCEDVIEKVFRVQISEEGRPTLATHRPRPVPMTLGRGVSPSQNPAGSPSAPSSNPHAPKVGRNDPCSCGSGKKYKKCCGV